MIRPRSPLHEHVSRGIGGIAGGAFDSEKTGDIDFDVLVTEDDYDITDETTEANLEP